ncbi:DUF1684 domain-containing protein [Streptomyces sp. SPB074]|uniref:DUF1684 domain-containing protein n=1 Tax=Streptomyces sp. (strain SPB074) TaxID=465543 RepID=UPI00017F1BAF|nr:DUF1684 domain-containing protein [Streptomyces sp. SPB074]EDY46890.1 conserved hypothetical protein [Streptomyces sp. SPB074]
MSPVPPGTAPAPAAPTGTDPADANAALADWRRWRAARAQAVTAPWGPLSVIGTHWLADYPDGLLPDIPGRWRAAGEHVSLTRGAGLLVRGRPYAGEALLDADTGPAERAQVAHRRRRLTVLESEGAWAVRVHDPDAPARRAFPGLEVSPWEARWALRGRFVPYESKQTVRVPNADGHERGLALGGELRFSAEGSAYVLRVGVQPDGGLGVIFADTTSGAGSHRFRFLFTPAPAPDGTVPVDFNRAVLPPCALGPHFLCPFPPPGNTLGLAVTAGERRLVDAGAGQPG